MTLADLRARTVCSLESSAAELVSPASLSLGLDLGSVGLGSVAAWRLSGVGSSLQVAQIVVQLATRHSNSLLDIAT